MGYKISQMNGDAGSMSSMYLDRSENDIVPAFDSILDSFNQTDIGKRVASKKGTPLYYLRAREEYAFYHTMKWFTSPIAENTSENDMLVPVVSKDGAKTAYRMNDHEILKLRRNLSTGKHSPLYKALSLKFIGGALREAFSNLPAFNRKTYFQQVSNKPFIETANKGRVLSYEESGKQGEGVYYDSYVNYAISRRMNMHEKAYDKIYNDSNFDFIMVYSDPFFADAEGLLEAVQKDKDDIPATFYGIRNSKGITFYIDKEPDAEPVFEFFWGSQNQEGYFDYINEAGYKVRYGKGYPSNGKVISADELSAIYSESVTSFALDRDFYYGASGKPKEDDEDETEPGLLSVIGPYITQADARAFAKSFNADVVYTKEMAQTLLDSLSWLYSEGYTFSIKAGKKGDSSSVELSLNEMTGNQKLVFYPDGDKLSVRIDSSMYNYVVTEHPGVSSTDAVRLLLRYARGDIMGKTSITPKGSSKTAEKATRGKGLSSAEVVIKGNDLVKAGLAKEDEVYLDDEIMTLKVFAEYPYFAPRFCYNHYVNGKGREIDPEGAFRLQTYIVSAMQNFVSTVKFDEITAAVRKATEGRELFEEDLEAIVDTFSEDPVIADIQRKYVSDLINIYSYVDRVGMAEDGSMISVEEFAENLRSVNEFSANESYKLSADNFANALMEQICREQIGEVYDIRGIDRDMLTASWADPSIEGQNMIDLLDNYGTYLTPSEVMRIDSETFMFEEDIDPEDKPDMSSRENCVCNFYPGRFNAAGVLEYGHANVSGPTKTALLSALVQMNYPLDRIYSDGEFSATTLQTALVRFDEASAVPYEYAEKPYEKHAMEVCRDALLASGALDNMDYPIDIAIDNQGIIRWSAYRNVSQGKKGLVPQFISGEIGQVPMQDSDVRENGFDGVYRTRFNSGDDFIFVPGYAGWFSMDGIYDESANEENGYNLRDRLRVRGFDSIFDSRIRQLVSKQMSQPYVDEKVAIRPNADGEGYETDSVPRMPVCLDGTGLNDTYRKDTYGMRLEYDFFDENRMDMSANDSVHATAFIESMKTKIRFLNSMKDTNTTSAVRRYRQSKASGYSDSFSPADRLALMRSGMKNMRIPSARTWGGIADSINIGGDSVMGFVFYLAKGAKVEGDRVIPTEYDPSEPFAPHSVLFDMPGFKYVKNNMASRARMVCQQLNEAKRIVRDVKIAYGTFYGWNFDDSYVISKEFAEKSSIISKEGLERALWRGDKVSCFEGNKGINSIIIDRNWTSEDLDRICGTKGYKRRMYEKILKVFKDNPEVDLFCSPFGPMSRQNAGLLLKGLDAQNQNSNLRFKHPDGTEDGAISVADIIIPHQTVEEKTTTYEGPTEGRKISSQLGWAMSSKGARKLISSLFKRNEYAWSDFREYLISTGMDLSKTGEIITNGYKPHLVPISETLAYSDDEADFIPEDRNEFYLPDFTDEEGNVLPLSKSKDREKFETDFKRTISGAGGFLMLPEDFGTLPDEVIARAKRLGVDFKGMIPSFYGDTQGLAENRKDLQVVTGKDGKRYRRVPILPPHLRRDSKNLDGQFITHDFTNQYESMYSAMLQWEAFVAGPLSHHQELDNKKFTEMVTEASRLSNYFSISFDNIQSTIIHKMNGKGTGKHSYARDELLSTLAVDSATSVFMPDPTLEIGEVAMDREIMKSLGIKDGEDILIWRDPVLRDGALRCVKARLDETVHGVAINPFCDYSMDGDFDGDTLGMIKIPEEAKEEAIRLFGYGDNLLELGAEPKEVDGKLNYPLYFNIAMDIKTAEVADPSLTVLRESIEKEANDLYRASKEKGVDIAAIREKQDALVKRLSDYSHKAYETAGDHMHTIDFTSRETIFNSFRKMALDGSKGKPGSLYDLFQYASWEVYDAKTGVSFEEMLEKKDELGDEFDEWFRTFKPEVKVSDKPLVSETEVEQCHEAAATKIDDTGSAGTKSQAMLMALREICPMDALNVTRAVTQYLVGFKPTELKHNPDMAQRVDSLVCTDMASLFDGKRPRCFYKDSKTKLEEITSAREFEDLFYRLLTDKDKMGVSVDRNAIKRISQALIVDGKFYSPAEYGRNFGTVLDNLAYGADGKEYFAFDMLQTLDGRKLSDRMDGKKIENSIIEAYVPDEIAVSKGTRESDYEVVRNELAENFGAHIERSHRVMIEEKRIEELTEQYKQAVEDLAVGFEQGDLSPAAIEEKRQNIDAMQKNLDKLVESRTKSSDARVLADAISEK